MTKPADHAALLEQRRYYEARAPEYDDWWFRRGRYDDGDGNTDWFADVAELEAALTHFAPRGRVLELACGSGLWTERLARHADEVTAVDASREMLALNKARVKSEHISKVEYVEADLFTWQPTTTYDVCFFSFWLSHVPAQRLPDFWDKVRRALAPAGRVFFIDSGAQSPFDDGAGGDRVSRRLADGREFKIVKRFYAPDALEEKLRRHGLAAAVAATSRFFIYGQASIRSAAPHTDKL